MPIIEAALCDNDGLLADTEPVLYASWEVLVARDGHDFRTFDYARIIGKPDIDCCRIVLAHYGIDRDPEEWHEEYKVIAHEIIDKGVSLRPGARDLIDRLDRAGVPIVLVTSGTKDYVRRVLGPHGLLPRFALLITADTPGLMARKPDPAPYLLAADRVLANPTRCIAFEDSPSGIRAAVDAGCFVYGVPHAYSPAAGLCHAHVLLPSLADFRVKDASAELLRHPGPIG